MIKNILEFISKLGSVSEDVQAYSEVLRMSVVISEKHGRDAGAKYLLDEVDKNPRLIHDRHTRKFIKAMRKKYGS